MRIMSFVILSALSVAAASASTLTTENIASVVGTVTSATDADFLNLFTGGATGPMPTWTLTETATDPSWSNWSGSFVGQLLGTGFDLNYSGTFSGNTLSWSTCGNLWRDYRRRRRLQHGLLPHFQHLPTRVRRHAGKRRRSLLHLRQSSPDLLIVTGPSS